MAQESNLAKLLPANAINKPNINVIENHLTNLDKMKKLNEIVKELHQDVQLSLPQSFDHVPEGPRKQAQNILTNKTLGSDQASLLEANEEDRQ
uniref:Uncharacterized protein n=1 Tax=Acrobeloides nanus TaxID=290746 RepID=A0A914DYJ8_9BILA